MLREEVEESRRERLRILDLIEEALSNRGSENGTHRGRGLLLLLILGSGAYAAIRMAKTAGFDSMGTMPWTRTAETETMGAGTPGASAAA